MSKNGLHRHYDRLTPEERFRLDVLAMARGDMQESERLVNTCPRQTYTMTDRGFGGRWSGAEKITLRVYIALGDALAGLRVIDAMRELVPYSQTLTSNLALDYYLKGHESGSRHAWAYAGKSGSPPAWPDDAPDGSMMEPEGDERDEAMDRDLDDLDAAVEMCNGFLPEILDRLERRIVADAFSAWGGYAAFCEESMGVAAEKVAGVILEPVIGSIRDMTQRAERLGIEASPETVEELREGLAETWRIVEKRDL